MTEQHFDIVILGGGSGGYAAALRAVQLGFSVALIEKDKVGGTCLHRGCVPTKALLHSAEVADTTRESEHFGIVAQLQNINMNAVAAYRNGIVAKKHKGLQGLLKAKNIITIAGEGRLTAQNTIEVNGQRIVGKNIILATGSYAKTLPTLPVGGRIITSDQALQLDFVPQRVIILGGGVIGVEFASMWKSFGADVTIIEGLPHLVPNEDETISKSLERSFKRRGINFLLNSRFSQAVQSEYGVFVSLEDDQNLQADLLFVAVGRGPVTDNLGFENVGIAMDRGYVLTNEHLQTNVPGIYAVGDIVPGLQLAHRAFQQGIFVAETIAGLNPQHISDINIPKVTYCEPEVASIGLTEKAAAERHGADNITTYDYNLAGNAKSEILGTSGSIKVIRQKEGPILGIHMIGSRVGELIGEAQLAVNWEAHPEDIAPLIHAHPTQNESLGEAFLHLAGKPLNTL